MLFIMKRMQIDLSEGIWNVLRVRSQQQGTTISELIRQAVRDKYGSPRASRKQAMQAVVGLRRNRKDLPDSETYARRLRKGKRLGSIVSPSSF
jgi:macrodomain Ter protein organizer (MatP/YcbG family)